MPDEPVPRRQQAAEPQEPSVKVREFPTGPGIYLMKDAAGDVIYVGKAKNLRSAPARTSPRTPTTIRASATGSASSATWISSKPPTPSPPCSPRRG